MSSSTSDKIIGYVSHIQRANTITKERFYSIRQYFFQSIGFSVLLYFFSQLPRLLYLALKLLFLLIFQIFSMIFWLPLKTVELFIPKTNNYGIIIPLFWLCSISSFSIAKFSHKNVGKRHSFILIFIIFFLLQSVFILLPIAASIHEQRKLSSTPVGFEQTIMKLSKMTGQENNFIKNSENNKREEFTSVNNEIKLNKATNNLSQKKIINFQNKLSTPLEKDSNIESDVEDDQDINTTENLQISSNEEKKLLSKKQANKLVNIWHRAQLSFQQLFSLSKKHLPPYNVSSIYTAFTDLNCYDYTKSIHRHKQNHIYFLNAYRHQSPFSIYLSIIKSNGPKCYPHHPNGSCAIRSKLFFPNLRRQLYRFIRFWVIISIPIIILTAIYKRFRSRQPSNLPNRSVEKTNDLPTQQISSNIYPLDKKIENKLRLWLVQEENNGYANISESCRTALNATFSKQYERLNIETLQFANAKIHNVSQTSIETIVINATLVIDHLFFNVTKDQHFSIQIPKLTGELEIHLMNNTIEVKFKQIQIDHAEIIDSKNVLSSDEKESIIKLLKEVINQTIVQCCFYLSDNQEKTQPSIPPIEPPPSPIIIQQCETPIITPINNTHEEKHPEKEVKKLLVRIVKAVKLHDVEQPFCILELNQPKQIHKTSIAKNGLNPFWDERFLFECNDKSNQIRLQIIDHKKPNNKKINTNIIDKIYADVSIPFAYITSTIYKQDVRITPQHPDSIIRIEFSTLTEEEALIDNNGYDIESATNSPNGSNVGREANKIEHVHRQSPSDEILTLAYNADGSPKDYNYENNTRPSRHSQPTTADAFSTSSPITSPDDDIQLDKPRKSRKLMNSFRIFSRRKKHEKKGIQNENGLISPINSLIQTNFISHSLSAEPFLPPNTADAPPLHRRHSISRSFRNFFHSNSKKKTINTSNFIIDHPDLLSTPIPTPKKRSFFRRFKTKQKQQMNLSTNSLTSDDCTRSESVRNTPIRANVGRPVTMTKPLV